MRKNKKREVKEDNKTVGYSKRKSGPLEAEKLLSEQAKDTWSIH